MGAPFFLAAREQIASGDAVRLDGAEGRHAAAVRRLAPGERVVLTDGHGLRADCRVTGAGRGHLDLAVEARRHVPPPQPRLVVVQALPKGDRGELAVELMTEVGVDLVVPWTATRCITRWKDDRAARALERWRASAREAAKQSRREWIPQVWPARSTAEVVKLLEVATLGVVLHEEVETPLAARPVPARGDVVTVVGPEGGITPEELQQFTAAGATVCRLGATVLRTSTAGAAALAVLLSRSARWQ